jgi:DNA-binding GntR family transcriptional regulator
MTAEAAGPNVAVRRVGRAESLTDQVAVELRAAVRDGRLVPGRLYSAYRLADELGVSRSPVREALLRLAEVGLVRFERNRGFRVLLPPPEDIAEVFAVRLALEVPAVRKVARRTDPAVVAALRAELAAMAAAAEAGDEPGFMRHDQRLHAVVLEAAGNRRAAAIVANLRDVTRLIGGSTVEVSRSLADVRAEHEPVVAAVERGDADAAASALAAHLEHTGRLLVAQAAREQGSELDVERLWLDVVG